nr:hypothetical protein [Pandoravirus massiliensis]
MFQFECTDGHVNRLVECVTRIFPQDTPVGALLSSTRWAAEPPTSTRLCIDYCTETVQFVLDFLEHDRRHAVDEQRVWAVRAEFVSMCDFLLLANTFAGLVARTLSTIAESATVKVVYEHPLPSPPFQPEDGSVVRVSVRVKPCLAPFSLFGLDLLGVPRGRFWTEPVVVEHTEHAHVSCPLEIINIAADAASRWTIAPLLDPAVIDGAKSLSKGVERMNRDTLVADRPHVPSGNVAIFRSLGVYKDPVILPIVDLFRTCAVDLIVE